MERERSQMEDVGQKIKLTPYVLPSPLIKQTHVPSFLSKNRSNQYLMGQNTNTALI